MVGVATTAVALPCRVPVPDRKAKVEPELATRSARRSLGCASGLATNVKKLLVQEVAQSIHHAYPIPDTCVFLREWTGEQMSIEGALGAPFRPVCDFVVPPGLRADGKRQLVAQVSSAIARACDLRAEAVPLPSGKKVNTKWVLSFFSEYPLDRAALDDLMAFENPMVLESQEGDR